MFLLVLGAFSLNCVSSFLVNLELFCTVLINVFFVSGVQENHLKKWSKAFQKMQPQRTPGFAGLALGNICKPSEQSSKRFRKPLRLGAGAVIGLLAKWEIAAKGVKNLRGLL